MGPGRLQESIPQAGWIPGRRIVSTPIAADRRIYSRPLRVVENIERLGAELHRDRFMDRKVFEQ